MARMGSDGAPPADTACFNAAITACDRGGQWARAAALLGDMRRLGIRPAPRRCPFRVSGEWGGLGRGDVRWR